MCTQILLISNTSNNKGVQGTWCKRYIYHQGQRQLPKSGGAEFPMLLDSNRRAHFHEGSKYAGNVHNYFQSAVT